MIKLFQENLQLQDDRKAADVFSVSAAVTKDATASGSKEDLYE